VHDFQKFLNIQYNPRNEELILFSDGSDLFGPEQKELNVLIRKTLCLLNADEIYVLGTIRRVMVKKEIGKAT
jgi:hypothetical protein